MRKYSEKKILENFKGFTPVGIAYSIINGIAVYWTYCDGRGDNFCLTESREESDSIKYGYDGWYDFRVEYLPDTCRCKDAVNKYESALKAFFAKTDY